MTDRICWPRMRRTRVSCAALRATGIILIPAYGDDHALPAPLLSILGSHRLWRYYLPSPCRYDPARERESRGSIHHELRESVRECSANYRARFLIKIWQQRTDPSHAHNICLQIIFGKYAGNIDRFEFYIAP